MHRTIALWLALLALLAWHALPPSRAPAQALLPSPLAARLDELARQYEPQVIAWRRDFHQHPELSNCEVRTARVIALHLERLGLEVRTEVGGTGVVGLLRGRAAEPVVALRADMDALPVTEATGLPFASREKTTYNGQEVDVMHACGHDAHMAILLGVAEVLAAARDQVPGTVKLIFQPAEEGDAGAARMIADGVLENPRPRAILGLHVLSGEPSGVIRYRPEGAMASADHLRILVRGRQTHAAMPWGGVDPVVVAAQIVLGLQAVVSRQVDLTTAPAVVSLATIHGGVRSNIIPDSVELTGTIRILDPAVQEEVHQRVRQTALRIAESAGATAEVEIGRGYPITYNDPALTGRMVAVLRHLLGDERVVLRGPLTAAEDFSYFQQQVPGFFFWLGVTPPTQDLRTAARNHSPQFYVDEGALITGVQALSHLAIACLATP
ncbi:MAG: amidohydrolase [Candidatus Latescibacterota bacterium]